MSLCTDLGLEFPIVQAPMAGAQGSAMALAVSNAGGLGALPCAMLAPEAMRKELEKLKAGTAKPYNVNFFCHVQPEPTAERERVWRGALAPYFKEFGIDPATIPAGPGRLPFSEEAADVLGEFKPAVVSFHFGLPSKELLQRVRAWGSKIWSSATTVDEARWLEAQGVDAIIAQGLEAGGHRGIFASEDARGVAAAKALGAAAVQVGTAYLLCSESTITPVHRKALKSDAVHHTALTNLFTGRPARGIMNRIMRELGPISGAAPAFPLATAAITALRAAAERGGSGDFSPLWCGQNASGCREIPAAEMTRTLAASL